MPPPSFSITNDRMKKTDLKKQVSEAISACVDKKAEGLALLELEQGSGAFTDYFVICSGTNPRQAHDARSVRVGRVKELPTLFRRLLVEDVVASRGT